MSDAGVVEPVFCMHGTRPFQSRVVSVPTKPRWMDVAMSRVPPAMCTELGGDPVNHMALIANGGEPHERKQKRDRARKNWRSEEERSVTETLNDDAIIHGHQQVADFASERPEAKAMSATSGGTCKRAAGPTDARH